MFLLDGGSVLPNDRLHKIIYTLSTIISVTEYAVLAAAAYNDTRGPNNKILESSLPPGWSSLSAFSPSDTSGNPFGSGFSATTFVNGKNVVISFEGTDFLTASGEGQNIGATAKDGIADVGLGLGLGSQQLFAAVSLYEQVKKANPDANITFTGHSLGAGLASVMSVWFNRKSTIFADAPFLLSAENPFLIAAIKAELLVIAGGDSDFVSLIPILNNIQISSRETNVTGYYVQGEVLNNDLGFTHAFVVGDGQNNMIPVGGGNAVGAVTLHSIVLHALLEMSSQFEKDTFALPTLLPEIFDTKLYARLLQASIPDFMTELLNASSPRIGTNGVSESALSLFAADLARLGPTNGSQAQSSSVISAVIAATIEDYYWQMFPSAQPDANYTGLTIKPFLKAVSGGVNVDLGEIAAIINGNPQLGRSQLVAAVDALILNNSATALGIIANADNWFVQAGNDGMKASGKGGGGNDVMIGGATGNDLIGGDGSNVLIAGAGSDTLHGGKGTNYEQAGFGNDWLYGQGSNDQFEFVPVGAITGTDYIADSNSGDGTIWVGNTQLTGAKTQASDFVWTGDDGTIYTYTPSATGAALGTLTISQGAVSAGDQIVIENFDLNMAQSAQGYLGIKFTEQSAVVAGNASDPFAIGNYNLTNASVAAQGDAQGLTIYASAISDQVQTITLSLAGLDPSQFMVNTGAAMLSFNNGSVTLTIPAGDASVTVGLVRTGDVTQNETAQLTAMLSNPNASSGTTAITSNSLSINFSGDPASASNSPSNTVIVGKLQPGSDSFSYTGDSGNDLVNTSTGENDVNVQDGNNVINGGGGQDYISAGNGRNLIVANGGQEFAIMGNGNNQIYANTQTDIATALTQAKAAQASGKRGNLISVGNGSNTIVGGNGNDLVFTGSGNNTLILGPGAVTVEGGAMAKFPISGDVVNWTASTQISSDLIAETTYTGFEKDSTGFNALNPYYANYIGDKPVGIGNDTIFGGTGNSVYYLSNGNNYLDAGGGNDFIGAGVGNNTIFGGTGNDTISGAGGINYINAESGNDLIAAYGGNSTIIGGTGNDTIFSGDNTSNWATSITDENNYISAGSGNSVLYGARGSDTLIGGSGNDTLYAGDGTQYLQAGSGNTAMSGGAGSDTLIGGSGKNTMFAGSGEQYLQAGDGATTMVGGAGNETMVGGSGDLYVEAGSGNATIIGGSGYAVIFGGTGNDSISAGDGGTDAARTQVIAGSGNTTIIGGNGVDYIGGGAGTDVLYAGNGGDVGLRTQVVAGSGNTTIFGGLGADNLVGGAGSDVIYAGDGGTADAPTLITGGSGNATIYGGAGVSQITTGSGSDTLIAGSGTNVFVGGAGAATYQINSDSGTTNIWDSTAADTLVFGAGVTIDSLVASETTYANGVAVTLTLSSGGSVTVDEGGLTQVGFADGTMVSLAQLLSPSLTVGDTTYASGNGILTSSTVAGTQKLTLTGNSDLTGTGNNVNNVITANSGNDTLIAGTANDTLIGGGASDVYVVSAASGTVTTINGSSGADTLSFTTGINLADLTASTTAASDGSLIVTLQNSAGGSVVINGGASGNLLDQISFADGTVASLGQLSAQLSTGPTAATSAVDVTLAAGIQNMTLTGTANVVATGNALGNVITANGGNDTLIAGTGNDTLVGGGGKATYVFNAGDTHVVINNSGTADTLVFGAGIGESDLTTTSAVVNGVTVVTITDNRGDSVAIQGGSLNQVSFADGNTATLSQLLASPYTIGTTTYSAVSATADAGIDALVMTGRANVTATANALNDTLIANGGNDTLIAGSGNDTLIGGGYDTYAIDSGSQVTTIKQSSYADTLTFGSGVGVANLSATAATAADGSSTITIQNSLSGSVVIDTDANDPLDQISFADGSTASLSVLLAQATTGITAATSAVDVTLAAGIQNMTLTGSANLVATGNAQDNVITANGGNDTLIAGAGNDTLVGGGGTASYVFNSGDANVVINNSGSADTLVFGGGIRASDLTTSSAVVNGVTLVTIADDQGGSVIIQGGNLNQLSFADGSTATLGQLLASSYTIGTTTYSTVSATAGTGIVTLAMTGSANVTATANALNDTIIANSGNDILIAGSGNDTLIGGIGATTYMVGSNSGITTISQAGVKDSLSFGTGISVGNLMATAAVAADGSTTVMIADSNGSNVVIDDYVNGMLDQLSFADGSSASLSALLPQVSAPGNGANTLKSYGWQLGNGSHGTETYHADGSVTQISYAPDGGGSNTTVDIHGNSSTSYFNVAGTLIGSRTASVSANSAGGQTVTTIDNYAVANALLSSSTITSDAKGDSTTVNYDGNGNTIRSTAITVNADGSTTTQIHNPSGQLISSSIAVTNAGGSITTTNYDANGNVTGSSNAIAEGARLTATTIFNAAGAQIGSSQTSSDGQGDSYTVTYDTAGVKNGNSWQNADGTAGSETLNADASSTSTVQTADGGYTFISNDGKGDIVSSQYNAARVKTSDNWQKTGISGSDVFNADGSSTAISTNAVGSYSITTDDGNGTVISTTFDANNVETGYSRKTPDGTATNDIFHSDGSSAETVALSNGTVTITQYNASGKETADSWTKADGTSGTDVFNSDGSFGGTTKNLDGTSISTFNDGHGGLTTTNFNTSGSKINDTWNKSNGSSGNDTFNADGSSSGSSLNADGTSGSYVNDGKGDITKTNFDTSGNRISDTWTKADGSSGADNFNSNGSKSGSSISASGVVTIYAVDSNGNSVAVGPSNTNVVTAQIAAMENSFTNNLIASLDSQLKAQAVDSYNNLHTANVTPIGVSVVNSDNVVIQGSDDDGAQLQSSTTSYTTSTTVMQPDSTSVTTGGQPIYTFMTLAQLVAKYGNPFTLPSSDSMVYGYNQDPGVGGSDRPLVLMGYEVQTGTTPLTTNTKTTWSPVTRMSTVNVTSYSMVGQIGEIDAGPDTNTIYLGTGQVIVNVGSADTFVGQDHTSAANKNDAAYEIENLTYADERFNKTPGLGLNAPVANGFIYGGSGNDTLLGSSGNDTIVAGTGNNFMNGCGGRDTYFINTTVNQGVDIIDDTGYYNLADYAVGADYLDDTVTYGGRIPTPTEVANDFLHTVEFNGSMTPDQLKFKFVPIAAVGNRLALDMSWGTSASVEVVLGDASKTGEGIQEFTFSNGTTLTMAQMLALAAVQPTDGAGTNIVTNADGNYVYTTDDGEGNTTTTELSIDGVMTDDRWSKSDGSSGTDNFNVDGTSSGNTRHADGSTNKYVNDGQGNVTTLNFNVNGVKVSDAWTKSNGNNGTDTFNTDGSYSATTNDGHGNIDTKKYDAQSHQTGDTWTASDGSSGMVAYSFDANGNKTGDTWTRSDGTHGSDIYNADQSSSATSYNEDGSYSTTTNDGQGAQATLNYDVAGNKQSGTWTLANGTYGKDIYSADGSSSGASFAVDGSVISYFNDGQGTVVTQSDSVSNNILSGTTTHVDFKGDTSTGADFVAIGSGNGAITLGAANSVVAVNAGDGQDTITSGTATTNTLSLGGGIAYNDLNFSKSGNDLALNTGGSDSITLLGWYGSAANQDVVTLQVMERTSGDYDPNSSNVLVNQGVEEFDFGQLVAQFDQARTQTPTITNWNLMDGLLNAHLSGSDTAAIGGDLAYYSGNTAGLGGMDVTAAVANLQDTQFGKGVQTIHAWSTISQSANTLR